MNVNMCVYEVCACVCVCVGVCMRKGCTTGRQPCAMWCTLNIIICYENIIVNYCYHAVEKKKILVLSCLHLDSGSRMVG